MTSPRRWVACAAVFGVAGFACSSDDAATDAPAPATGPAEAATLITFRDAQPGDIVGLAADDERGVLSWLHRRDGTIHEFVLGDPGDPDPAARTVTRLAIGAEGLQSGLLDQEFLPDGRRVLTWTTPDTEELVVGTLDAEASEAEPIIVWSAGEAGNGAIGGKLDVTDDGAILLTIGRNTAWDAETDLSGAVLRFDGPLDPGAEPTTVSTGYTNPWAFESLTGPDGSPEIWIWDNAAGDDPENPGVEDVERLGRADLGDRPSLARSEMPDRAPAAMVELPDGRIGVCGFLDNELRAYEITDGPMGARTELERAGTIMPCNTGATVFADGTIATAAQTSDGESLQLLRP